MKNRKWQRIIAFAASAAMVLSMNGVQMMLTETGGSVHAEELDDSIILDEEWPAGTAADQTASEGEEVVAQEIDAWSSLEEPEIVVEGIEISSGEEADRATGMSSTTAAEAAEKMLVDVRLTEEAAEKKGSREQGEVQWMHIFAADRSGAASGAATVRIYLTDRVTGKPAEDAEVLLFTKWQEELPQTVILPPVVLKNALNKNQELSVARIREYEKNEDGSDKKDEQGRKVAAYDYLEFELPAGGCAEFAAALLYRTSEPEYEYRVTARANAVQMTASGSELVLYQDYPDEENDNELTAVWEPQAAGNETAGAGNGGAGSETAGEIETESESEESTEAGTEEKSEVSGEAGSDTEGEESSAAGSETEGETETAPESEETESEINGEAGNKTDSEGSSESESETEIATESEIESESESVTESEIATESESETEIESESEIATESESETEIESESESETESESEAESETNPAQLPENLPVSSIRVTMTKELEETDAPEEIQEAEILPEASGDAAAGDVPADEGSEDITAEAAGAAESNVGQTTEDSSEEKAADDADQQNDNTEQTENTDGPAVSGQTYIVHVQAADLQPDAKYDSTVYIYLTDLATGLPASDVATAVCQMKESIAETDPAAVNILYGAVQTPNGRENLTVTRVQETGSAEDGPETVTEEYLKFDLPAGGSTDFYLGFTYATEEEAYEKQLMIDVKAVQYIPVQDLESTAQSERQNAPENTADVPLSPEDVASENAADLPLSPEDVAPENTADAIPDISLEAPENTAGDIAADAAMKNIVEEELFEDVSAGAADTDQELLSAAELSANDERSIKTQSADEEEAIRAGGAENEGAEQTGDAAVTVEAADEVQGAPSTQMIAVDVLEEQTQPVTMLWSAARATGKKTIYFDTCGNGGWNGWTENCQMYIYLIGPDTWHDMNLSSRKNTLHTECSGVLWEYTIVESNCTGIIFSNSGNFTAGAPTQTEDVILANQSWVSFVNPCFRLTGGSGAGGKKTVTCLGDMGTLSCAGKDLYFFDFLSDPTQTGQTIKAIFSGNGVESREVVMQPDADGFFKTQIPQDQGENPYSTVVFQDSAGQQLGDSYNFLNDPQEGETAIEYKDPSVNTFYYGATEKADGTLLHTWGGYPGNTVITGKKLYFSTIDFPADTPGKLQVGTNNPVELKADAKDATTLSCEMTEATTRTILTYTASDEEGKEVRYHFLWTNTEKNQVSLENEIAGVSDTYVKGYRVYYDATLSKLSYAGSATDASIPLENHKIYYHAWNSDADVADGEMISAGEHSKSGNVWKDVYVAALDKQYKNILFYSSSALKQFPAASQKAAQTVNLQIPWDTKKNPCFYADTSDSVIYDNQNRAGYWDEVYTIRSPEKEGSGENSVVDIASSSFTRENDTLYVNSSFYDYYTDYELNGKNRDHYQGANGASHRNWVNFRQFDQALSDYYESCKAEIPLYTGHFQPYNDAFKFDGTIAQTLGLYGFNNYNNFISANNSAYDLNHQDGRYSCAAQGLVNSQLSGGLPTVKNGGAVLPHFNEAFLSGSNSKNTEIGKVYHNVSFPFKQKDVKNDGVKYWYFDSAETTLAMRQDTATGQYYLADTGNRAWAQNVNSSGTTTGNDSVSTKYGFFPFNETAAGISGKNYNYGFGTRLEFKFRLTEDGTVLNNRNEKVPIEFQFSGDDDVWVFIDGKLALDVGGAHGRVTGSLNFQTKQATVSEVKASAGSSTSGKGVTSPFNMNGSNTSEHTLTMFYMERGMWESNMKVMFNFPDENELEVEKQVDKTAVNELFAGLFENASLFTFRIKNLATHYGSKAVTSTEGEAAKPVNFSVTGTSSVSGNTCERTAFGGKSAVHWYAKEEDRTSAWRHKRYGTMSGNTVDVSNMSYLEFKLYYDYGDNPSLANMYLQLVDTDGKVKGNMSQAGISSTDTLAGKTYGTVVMRGRNWITIRVDLDRLSAQSGFNNQVSAIKFGYNFPRNIYLADFVFYPSSTGSQLTGFVTKQYDIPDYGSATSGKLEIPVGAKYTSSNQKNYAIGEDGIFVLENRESVVFRDQFRRGSYIALQEEDAGGLFDTTWTMYEDGYPVTTMNSGSTVTGGGGSLSGVSGKVVNDGRREMYLSGPDSEGMELSNAYGGNKPEEPAFVFRSYSNPDYTTGTTKLKIVFHNKIRTGSLRLRKEKAYESDMLEGSYTFTVTFTNVGGLGLESAPIEKTITLKAGEEQTITGIPIGTHYVIAEEKPADGSSLEKVELLPENTSFAAVDSETRTVSGTVDENTVVTAVFKNTKKPLIDIQVEKLWKNADDSDYPEDQRPESIFVQLQRREKETQAAYANVGVPAAVTSSYTGWYYSFSGLDKYVDYTETPQKEWEYRVVEVKKDGENYTVLEEGAENAGFRVTYPEYTGALPENIDQMCVIKNTYAPETAIQITKVSASNPDNKLGNVEFLLEKLKDDGVTVDDAFTPVTRTTGAAGDTEGIALFEGLKDGTYRLTETKAASGYSLLKAPVTVVIDRSGNSLVADDAAKFSPDGETILITITNQAKFQIPATGSWSRYIISFSGVILAGAAIIMYLLQKRRKEGKTS